MPKLRFFSGIFVLIIQIVFIPPVFSGNPGGGQVSDFGINSTPKSIAEDLIAAVELGAKTIRIPLRWQIVEPAAGTFDWSFTDKVMSEAESKGIEVLWLLRSISDWGTAGSSKKKGNYGSGSMPARMGDWDFFLTSLVERYKGRKVFYEIENEVNSVAFWEPDLPDSERIEHYCRMLTSSYSAIKKADRNAPVLASGLACGITRDFPEARLEQVKQNGAKWFDAIFSTGSFDVISVHNYYYPDREINGLTFGSYLDAILNNLKKHHVSGKAVWITEAGFISRNEKVGRRNDQGSPDYQRRLFEETVRQAREKGVERYLWIMVKDRNEPYFGSMGVKDFSGRKKPIWEAIEK